MTKIETTWGLASRAACNHAKPRTSNLFQTVVEWPVLQQKNLEIFV